MIGGIDHPRDLALAELLSFAPFIGSIDRHSALRNPSLELTWTTKSKWMSTGQPDEIENHIELL